MQKESRKKYFENVNRHLFVETLRVSTFSSPKMPESVPNTILIYLETNEEEMFAVVRSLGNALLGITTRSTRLSTVMVRNAHVLRGGE